MGCEVSHGHDSRGPDAGKLTLPAGHIWGKLPVVCGVLGVAFVAATFALGQSDTRQLAFSWLVAFMYFLSLALGGLFFVIVQFAARAGWSVVVRRLAETIMATLPLFVVLFVPIALSMHDLFHWTHHEAVEADPILKGKSGYLNETFFFIRAGGYFAIWAALSVWFFRKSTAQDVSADPEVTRKLQIVSGPAIGLFAMTLTFASFDWLMSLDPHWYSTMFGVYYFAGAVVAIFAFLAVVLIAMRATGLLEGIVTAEHFHDLGKLTFAFTVFWTYIAFSQYFLIWYGNIPEETTWFGERMHGSWSGVTLTLALGHFVIPFFFLLPRTIKRHAVTLGIGASWMLLMHLLDMYWLVMPNLHPEGVSIAATDVTAVLGVGGLFAATFLWMQKRHALIPIHDPRLPESLSFENF